MNYLLDDENNILNKSIFKLHSFASLVEKMFNVRHFKKLYISKNTNMCVCICKRKTKFVVNIQLIYIFDFKNQDNYICLEINYVFDISAV